jgi:hypothetical protein
MFIKHLHPVKGHMGLMHVLSASKVLSINTSAQIFELRRRKEIGYGIRELLCVASRVDENCVSRPRISLGSVALVHMDASK